MDFFWNILKIGTVAMGWSQLIASSTYRISYKSLNIIKHILSGFCFMTKQIYSLVAKFLSPQVHIHIHTQMVQILLITFKNSKVKRARVFILIFWPLKRRTLSPTNVSITLNHGELVFFEQVNILQKIFSKKFLYVFSEKQCN